MFLTWAPAQSDCKYTQGESEVAPKTQGLGRMKGLRQRSEHKAHLTLSSSFPPEDAGSRLEVQTYLDKHTDLMHNGY